MTDSDLLYGIGLWRCSPWPNTAIDLATSYVWAELHTTPVNPEARNTSRLARRVATDLASRGWRLERVQRTILEECSRPSFARSLVPRIGGLEAYLAYYIIERAHTGRYTQGQTPWQTLVGARKMRPR